LGGGGAWYRAPPNVGGENLFFLGSVKILIETPLKGNFFGEKKKKKKKQK